MKKSYLGINHFSSIRMKVNIVFILAGALSTNLAYPQYQIKQIDSIISVAKKSDNIEQQLRLINFSYKAAQAIDYEEGLIQSLIFKAGVIINAGKYSEASKFIAKAEYLAHKINDPLYITQSLILKSTLHSRLGFYTVGRQILQESILTSIDIKDDDERHNNLGIIYAAIAKADQASGSDVKSSFSFIEKSYQEFAKIKDLRKYAKGINLAAYNLGIAFTNRGKQDSAMIYFKKATLVTGNNITAAAHNSLAKLYYQQKQYDTALVHYKKAEDISIELDNPQQLKKAYTGLAKVYTALDENKKAAWYLDKSEGLADSIKKIEKSAIKIPLDYLAKDQEKLIANNKSHYQLIIAAISALLFTVVFGVVFYRRRFKKEIKLSAEKMNELIRKIELNKDNNSSARIEQLKTIVQLAISNDPAFFLEFNKFDPEFGKKLSTMVPNLIVTEIEFCALLRLNFETKEIARYTRTSVRSVEGKKYRIRKKLNIPSNQDINLWMANL